MLKLDLFSMGETVSSLVSADAFVGVSALRTCSLKMACTEDQGSAVSREKILESTRRFSIFMNILSVLINQGSNFSIDSLIRVSGY